MWLGGWGRSRCHCGCPTRAFATLNTDKARAHGLVTRPLAETLADALAFENQRTTPMGAGLTDAEERELRAVAINFFPSSHAGRPGPAAPPS